MLLSIYGSYQILPLHGFATLIYNFLGQRAYQLNKYSNYQHNLYCYRL